MLPKRQSKKYVDSLNYEEIQDKLNSIMNMLCRKHNTKKTTSNDNEDLNEKKKESYAYPRTKKLRNCFKSIATKKNLMAGLTNQMVKICVFYGQSKIKSYRKRKK